MQECMEMIVEALGVPGVQSLWAPLMQLEAANARQLQWLAVLACWSALANLHLAFHSSITPQQFQNKHSMSMTSTAKGGLVFLEIRHCNELFDIQTAPVSCTCTHYPRHWFPLLF